MHAVLTCHLGNLCANMPAAVLTCQLSNFCAPPACCCADLSAQQLLRTHACCCADLPTQQLMRTHPAAVLAVPHVPLRHPVRAQAHLLAMQPDDRKKQQRRSGRSRRRRRSRGVCCCRPLPANAATALGPCRSSFSSHVSHAVAVRRSRRVLLAARVLKEATRQRPHASSLAWVSR